MLQIIGIKYGYLKIKYMFLDRNNLTQNITVHLA